MMKKIMMVVSLVLLISLASANGLIVSVSDTTGAKGAAVEVPINLESATDIGSIDIVLSYDSGVLQAIGVETGELGKSAYLESNTAGDGEVIIAMADPSGINGDGPVAVISFEVIGDVDSSSPLIVDEISLHNIERVEVIATSLNGMFSVTAETESSGDEGAAVFAIAAILMALFVIKRQRYS